ELELGERVPGVTVDVAFLRGAVPVAAGPVDPDAGTDHLIPDTAYVVAEPGDRVPVSPEPGEKAANWHCGRLRLRARGHRLNDGVPDDQEGRHALLTGGELAVHDAPHRGEDPVVPGVERGEVLDEVGHMEQLADGHGACRPGAGSVERKGRRSGPAARSRVFRLSVPREVLT